MERLRAAWPPALSGLLLLLAFPPFDLAPILFVALIPWLLSLESCSSKGAWKRGYLFGFVFAVGRLHWLDVLTVNWTHSEGLGLVPWLLASLAMAVYFGLLGMGLRVAWVSGRIWLAPLIWAGMEVFRSYFPVLAFPWGLLAMPLWRYPALIQPAYFGSIFLVGALVVAVNLAIVLVIRKRMHVAAFVGGTALLVFTAGLLHFAFPSPARPVPVLIGQTGSDMAFGDPATQMRKTWAAIDQFVFVGIASHARLLVLPEGVARMTGTSDRLPFHLDPRLPTLFGAQRGTRRVYQSAVGYDGRFAWVDKTRLVIFGEFVPGRDYLPFLAAFHLPSGDLSVGEHGTQAVTIGGLTIGPVVCFEGMFPDVAYRQAMNGAQLLAVISDDDWFMGTSAPEEFRAGSVWRAVETGLPVVRAASLGYSLAADGNGRVLAEAPLGRMDPLAVDVPMPLGPPTLRAEPVFPLFSLAVLLALPILSRRVRTEEGDHGR